MFDPIYVTEVLNDRVASAANISNELPLSDSFPARNRQRGKVPICGNPPIPMLNKDTIAKGPHSIHAIRRCPAVLHIPHGSSGYRIDRLAIAVGKRNIYPVVTRVGVPGVPGQRIGKASIGNRASLAHAA